MLDTIAIGFDGSSTAGKAVALGAEIARRFDADVVLLSAVGEASAPPGDLEVDTSELSWASNPPARVHAALAKARDGLRREGVRCRTLADAGDPGEVLVRLADECGADILVVGSKGMQRRILGSVPNTVTHKAGCSVLVVKTG
jgi:nucleotide-binding universal stress UspA family protein